MSQVAEFRTMVRSVVDLFIKPQVTSAELREAKRKIDVAEAARCVEELEASRLAALVTATSADLDALDKQITEAKRNVERAVAALDQLDRKLMEVEAIELEAKAVKYSADGRKIQRAMGQAYIEFDTRCNEADATLSKIKEMETELREINEFMREHGGKKLDHPLGLLSAHLGRPNVINGTYPLAADPNRKLLQRFKEVEL